LFSSRGRAGKGFRIEPGHDFGDVPLFDAAWYVRSKQPDRPKLCPLVPVIAAILEADKTAPPKQGHTAKRIFEWLRTEHPFLGGQRRRAVA
jgi:hypothetical protein